jgi:hypothetical protein
MPERQNQNQSSQGSGKKDPTLRVGGAMHAMRA